VTSACYSARPGCRRRRPRTTS